MLAIVDGVMADEEVEVMEGIIRVQKRIEMVIGVIE